MDPDMVSFAQFQLDLTCRELRANGFPTAVQNIPLELLILLVRKSPAIVTREEIVKAIWGKDRFVDAEHGINTAVRKLRHVLGDDPERPRFIQTVVGKGYRFIGSIEAPCEEGRHLEREPKAQSRIRSRRIFSGAALVLVGLGVLGIIIKSHFAPSRTEAATATLRIALRPPLQHDLVLIADFENRTGDPVFNETLREGLAAQLEQSPFLSVVSDQQIAGELRLMRRPPTTRLTTGLTREVCERMGGTAALHGLLARIGHAYSLVLDALNCSTGASVARAEAIAADKSHILGALGTAAASMRSKLGESLASIQNFNTPLEQVTTPSLEALQAYSLGTKIRNAEGSSAEAIPFFQRATTLDPDFAFAYLQWGASYYHLGEAERGSDKVRKAFELRGHTSYREKLRITEDYYSGVTGQLERAVETGQLAAQTYPQDTAIYDTMGAEDMWLGRWPEARSNFLAQIRVAPQSIIAYVDLEFAYVALNQFQDAQAGLSRVSGSPFSPFLAYELAFARGDKAGMQNELAATASAPATEFLDLAQADTEAYYGRLAASRSWIQKAVESAEQNGRSESAALYQLGQALREAEFGFSGEAIRDASAAWHDDPTTEVRVVAALVFARAGNPGRASRIADVLDRKYPADSIYREYWNTTTQASIALDRGDPSQALNLLEKATPVELSSFSIFPNAATMYPVYVRGEAYLKLHDGAQAADEFQKILDHRGLVLNSPIAALAQLQIARAYELQREEDKARTAYLKFLGSWKNADPNIPFLAAAKSEYAQLH